MYQCYNTKHTGYFFKGEKLGPHNYYIYIYNNHGLYNTPWTRLLNFAPRRGGEGGRGFDQEGIPGCPPPLGSSLIPLKCPENHMSFLLKYTKNYSKDL